MLSQFENPRIIEPQGISSRIYVRILFTRILFFSPESSAVRPKLQLDGSDIRNASNL